MTNLLLAFALLLGLAAIVLLVLLLRRDARTPAFERLERAQERAERSLREEFARNREEFGAALKGTGDTLNRQLAALVQMNDQRLERIREVLEARLRQLQEDNA
ncbi:MAG TPA: hypothetical protein VN436_02715, partial [Holophaga sp.]|nr:hypothetical protein [Holophaga sp.]